MTAAEAKTYFENHSNTLIIDKTDDDAYLLKTDVWDNEQEPTELLDAINAAIEFLATS